MATLYYPLHVRLMSGIRKPGLAAALSTLLVTVTVVVPIAFAVTAIVRALRGDNAPGTEQLLQTLDSLGARIGFAHGELQAMVQAKLQDASTTLLRGSLSAATATGGGIIQFVVAMGAFHLSLIHGTWLHQEIVRSCPLGRIRARIAPKHGGVRHSHQFLRDCGRSGGAGNFARGRCLDCWTPCPSTMGPRRHDRLGAAIRRFRAGVDSRIGVAAGARQDRGGRFLPRVGSGVGGQHRQHRAAVGRVFKYARQRTLGLHLFAGRDAGVWTHRTVCRSCRVGRWTDAGRNVAGRSGSC